jgi:hypothetical protein
LVETEGDRHIEVYDSFTLTDSIQLGIRDYLSLSHLWAACYLARGAASVERADDGLPSRSERHFAQIVAAIGAAADFLDGTVNELIQDARDDNPGGPTQHMTPAQRTAVATTPPLADLRRSGVLDKYDIAASAAGVLPIARGLRVGQDADLLLAVKNALSHSVPETVTTVADDASALTVQQMEQRLRMLKLPRNPFAGPGQPFFPRMVATHRLAAWCCDAAMTYVEAYFRLFNVPPPFEHMRPSLLT